MSDRIYFDAVRYKAEMHNGIWIVTRRRNQYRRTGASSLMLTDPLLLATFRFASSSNLGRAVEAAGKWAAFDTMYGPGPLGIHRAWDAAHDPLFGFIAAARNRTLHNWVPHMTHDFLTPMSLPLPGVAHSEFLRLLYVAGFNVRTVVAAPALGILITELLTWGQEPDCKRKAHLWGAGITGGLAIALFPFLAQTTVVALACTAITHLAMALFHHFKHRRRRPKPRMTDVLWSPRNPGPTLPVAA